MRILRFTREKKELVFKGTRIDERPDFPAELTKKRRCVDTVEQRLRERNLKIVSLVPVPAEGHC